MLREAKKLGCKKTDRLQKIFSGKMTQTLFLRLFLIAGGVFSMVAAIKDWDWFMTHRRAWIFVKLLGRKGARIFYIALGFFIIFIAVFKLG